jgi:MFS family permease
LLCCRTHVLLLLQDRPRFQSPWSPLQIVLGPEIALHVSVMVVGYSTYICSLAVLPFYLSRPPYSMTTASIGAAYLPGALAAMLASPCGGKLADLAGRANPQQPLRRLVYANLLSIPLMPLSVLVLGWGLQKGVPLALPLVALLVASFLNCLYMPALFAVSKGQACAGMLLGVFCCVACMCA